MNDSRDLNRFIIRMPEGLRDRIAAAAKKSGRSMNSEIVGVLDAAFPQRPGTKELLPELEKIVERLKLEPDRHLSFGAQYELYSLVAQTQAVGLFEDEPKEPSWDPFGPGKRLVDFGPAQCAPEEMTEDQMIASADKVRSQAGDAADVAMVGMDATREQKASRRRELTDEPAVVGKARVKGKLRSSHRDDPEGTK